MADFAYLPSFREISNDIDVFISREAEVDEPFSVEHLRCILQQGDAPPVILDKIIVGGEDGDNTSLNRKIRNFYLETG